MIYIKTQFLIINSLILLFLASFQSLAQQIQTQRPQKYTAYQTIDSLKIDGIPDEISWKRSSWSSDFIDIEGVKTPTYRTRMKMLYDADYLYIYAELEEPHIWATLKKRDTIIFYNNDFEVFIDPDGDTHNYMEFEMNALNTVWDLFLTKPYRNNGKVLDAWDFKGLKSAMSINGSLNDPGNTDESWSVEIALPWKVLGEAAAFEEPPVNSFWRINFSRVNWRFELKNDRYSRKKDSTGKFLPEYNWVWSPQHVINMHEPERWGYVYFSPQNVGGRDTLKIPEDEQVKWILYDLYRDKRSDFNKNNRKKSSDKPLILQSMTVDGNKIVPRFERHLTGWDLSVVSPFSGKILIIEEDGQFMKLSDD